MLTFLQHANFKTFHEATGLAGLPSPLGDLTFVGGRTAVLNVPCGGTETQVYCSVCPEGTHQKLETKKAEHITCNKQQKQKFTTPLRD